VCPEIEVLKHHGQLRSYALQLFAVSGVERTVSRLRLDLFAIYVDASRVCSLEKVDTAEKSTLPGAARADDAYHVTSVGTERYALEHFIVTKTLVKILNL
jgi:hypothetical protein